ncbi:flagellar hook-length control protein FliK [Sphingomonas psychrotolerans]|uniref:Flagellar hook-length control protein-like C-terminal domain-containing protein n=1 Tax=Sphingomonas psychrotolerans TaxID=1327635 RepID=A0A2K8MDU5_9SPHN|nr:flagellar hook-length control protein FliK [Sphingomonas psychrotolerans]ATY32072.1 hypothetical protein CVN68_08870 [Sphingomonas psychrotolerans]
MQINPFGFPLGAGMQSAPANGAVSLGFVDALGLALDGGAAQQPMALKASVTPPANFGPKLAQTLLEQAQLAAPAQPMPAPGILPGLQQPTSLSELMATAARLPVAEPAPAAAIDTVMVELPVVAAETDPSAVAPEITTPAPTPLAAAPPTTAAPAPAPIAPATTTPAAPAPVAAPAVPIQGDIELQPDGDTPPNAPATAAPAENPPSSKPQKTVRSRAAAAEADPVTLIDANPAVPTAALAINAVPQPILPQQATPREASTSAPGGSTVSKTGKVAALAAPGQDAAQAAPGTGTGTADFARAVAMKSDSTGSQSNPDGQPQPEIMPAATARVEAAAPILPQPAVGSAPVDPARATAPVSAEPVIEARAGHLGHSLGVEIARKVELGEETLRIRLNPVELGRIEVTLAFDDKGSLQATVRTDSAQAMDLLRQDAPDLARTLDQAGVRTDAQSFRFENRGGDGGGQQAQQQQSQNRGRFASSDDDAALAEPIYRPVRSDGQVDLLA